MKSLRSALVLLSLLLCSNAARAAFYTVTSTVDNAYSVSHGGNKSAGTPFRTSATALLTPPAATLWSPYTGTLTTNGGTISTTNFVSGKTLLYPLSYC